MTDYPNALPKTFRLHEYEIVRVLGVGGFGVTYLALDDHLNKPVAIKEYLPNDLAVRVEGTSVHPKSSSDRDDFQWGLDRFLDEARTLARFDHPSIIRVIRFFKAHDTAYIVMEYAEGKTLAAHLRDHGPLDEDELKAILLPLLDGLEQVHQADLLHRDIKPDNIILRADGSPVLIDFGAARQQVVGRSRSVSAVVTPGYSPQEQYWTRGNQGPWTDIYALGAVCYVALTGEKPPEAPSRVREDPLKPLSELTGDRVGRVFALAVDRALAVFEEKRPQSVGHWRLMLEGRDIRAESGPTDADRPIKRRGRVYTVFAMLLLAGLGVVMWRSELISKSDPDLPERVPVVIEPTRSDDDEVEMQVSAVEDAIIDTFKTIFGISSPQPGETFEDCPDCPEMVVIPGGSFRMGSPLGEAGRDDDEGPQHTVSLRAFALAKTEVTFAQWDACVQAGGCSHRPDDENWGRSNKPVINVSWEDAQEYVRWLSEQTGEEYRLPSEAEWEYAARAGTTSSFHTGYCITTAQANFNGNYPIDGCPPPGEYRQRTVSVGSFAANNFGLHDMHGNVLEWVQDCWNDNYRGAPPDGSAWMSGVCSRAVLRGGSWGYVGRSLRSAFRVRGGRDYRFYFSGFRPARSVAL